MAGNVSDETFARAAQQGGGVSYDDVEAARAVQAESAKHGVVVPLAEVLVRQGVITAKTRENIEKKSLAQQAGGLAQLGPYKLIKKLGEGGMGAVYLADDLNVGRKVAVKVLPKKKAGDPEFLTRFRREAKAAGALNHANIVGAFTIGEDQGFHFIAMEYCEGEPLDKMLKRDGLLPWDKALEIIIQVARGLKHAHDHGFIHRDIKPANIMLCAPRGVAGCQPADSQQADGLLHKGFVAKILDLGLSKNVGEGEHSFLTQTNVALGTPHYISPEQAKGDKNIDGRTDIYSLGVTFYHLVTGQTPFQGSTSTIIMAQHINQKLPNLQAINPEVPDGVVWVIQKMMAKKPADRYDGCQKLLDDLELVKDGKMPSQTAVPVRPAAMRQQASGARRQAVRQATVLAEPGSAASPSRKRNVYIAAGVGVLAVLALVIGLVISSVNSAEQQAAVRAAEDKRKAEAAETERLAGQNRKAEETRLKNEAARQEEERRKLAEDKRKAEEAKLEEEQRKLAEDRQKQEAARLAAEAKKKTETEKEPGTGTAGVRPLSDPVAPTTKAQTVKVAEPEAKANEQDAAQAAADARAAKGKQAFSAVLKETAPLLAQNRFADAISLLERKAKDPVLADAVELIKQEQAGVESVVELRKAAIEALRKQAGQQIALKKGGTEFKGKVMNDPKPDVITLNMGGAQMTFNAMQLSPEDVDQHAPKTANMGADLRRRGILYLAAGNVAKAKEYLNAPQTFDPGRYLDRIAALETGDAEAAALKGWERAEKLFAAKDMIGAKALYGLFEAEHGTTQTAAKQAQTLKERYEAIEKAVGPPKELALDLGGGVKVELVLIPAGKFLMGLPDNETTGRFDDGREGPQHEVTITKPFYMGKYEVTVAQFRAFADAAKYQTDAENAGEALMWDGKGQGQWVQVKGMSWRKPGFPQEDNHPACVLTWNDAQEFCKWAAVKTGRAACLPTEAQWEYACRAGTKSRCNLGDKEADLEKAGWFCKNSGIHTHACGQKKPNAWGLYDMHGNASEWCQDYFSPTYYAESPPVDPQGPTAGNPRLLRSGSWASVPWCCGSASRIRQQPDHTDNGDGFRVLVECSSSRTETAIQPAAPSQKAETGPLLKEVALDLGGVKIEMVPIAAGEFTMGADNEGDVERPAHKVRISRPFYMAKYITTVAQFRAFADATKYVTEAEKRGRGNTWLDGWRDLPGVNWRAPSFPQEDNHPACVITWNDVQEFCKWASKKTGRAIYLPTEAQWEYACRAGTTTLYYTGDKATDWQEAAWCFRNSGGHTHPCGQKKPNAWGLYDMHGNVWEWVQDYYSATYFAESPPVDPKGPKKGLNRVLRGGNWLNSPFDCRSTIRGEAGAGNQFTDRGFRVVMEGAPRTP